MTEINKVSIETLTAQEYHLSDPRLMMEFLDDACEKFGGMNKFRLEFISEAGLILTVAHDWEESEKREQLFAEFIKSAGEGFLPEDIDVIATPF